VAAWLAHPELPGCADCKAWLYDVRWKRCTRAGQPVPRPEGTPTPCHKCPKGPTPFEKELTPQNLAALRHYQECKATGRFPVDAVVERNAGLIRMVEDGHDRSKLDFSPLLLALAGKKP
jgi:hypothetical protein